MEPMKKIRKIKLAGLDKFLFISLGIILVAHYTRIFSHNIDQNFLTILASIATAPVIWSAYLALKNKKFSVDLLASIALAVSLLNGEWASAVFINLMLTSARIFADYTSNRARLAIKSLLKLRPEKVRIKRGNQIIESSLSKIKIGDLVVVEMGERIPVDGIIESGQASIDQSSLTGESMPVDKEEGEKVFSSTLNISGSIVIKSQKVGKDTAFEKIIRLVEDSQRNKAEIQTTVDRFTTFYIILTFVGSLIIFIFSKDIKLVLAVLLVACADDIAVAVPMAFSAAIGQAGKRGIIIKGGAYLEGLNKVKTIIFDKTGTITKGNLTVERVINFSGFTEEKVLELAAIGECLSDHPIAKAIVKYIQKKRIDFKESEKFEEISGRGSIATFQGEKIICGKNKFLEEKGVTIGEEDAKKIEDIKKQAAKSIVLIGYGKNLAGLFVLSDEIREGAKEEIKKLFKRGIKNIIMLTGDNQESAKFVANKVGIKDFHANLLPEDKVAFLKKYLGGKEKVAMVGDGVNDAASLALADVGIAMGAIGTDAAIEAADVALMKDDFTKISETFGLASAVARISKQDFWIWGFVNAIGLALVFGRIIGPEGAAAFNFITDFFPIINSLRLIRTKL